MTRTDLSHPRGGVGTLCACLLLLVATCLSGQQGGAFAIWLQPPPAAPNGVESGSGVPDGPGLTPRLLPQFSLRADEKRLAGWTAHSTSGDKSVLRPDPPGPAAACLSDAAAGQPVHAAPSLRCGLPCGARAPPDLA